MYAIVATGGKQYKVAPGEKLKVEKIEGSIGDKYVLKDVLFISESKAVGAPYIEGAEVEAEIIKQGKLKKVIVYKYKPKKGYHKKNGHRQLFTELEIEKISLNGEVLAEYVPEEEEAEEEAAEETEEATEEAAEETEEAAEETQEEALEETAEEAAEETIEEAAEEAEEETVQEAEEETVQEAAEEIAEEITEEATQEAAEEASETSDVSSEETEEV